MNDVAQDTWYYSKGGERLGPVSFVELQAQAKANALNPRHDMVWKHGMPDWQPAGDIPDLFERKVVVPPPSLAPPADPYSSPQQESVATQMGRSTDWAGARRRSYIFFTMIFPYLWAAILGFGMPFLIKTFGEQIMNVGAPVLILLPILLCIFIFFRRLVNLGMSCWWFIGAFIPFLNFWLGYRLFACPGGYAYSKKLGPAGIFLALLYWGSLLFLILLGVALALISMGTIGSPELKKQVIDLLTQYGPVMDEKLKHTLEMAPAAKP
jgi:GYF domain 2